MTLLCPEVIHKEPQVESGQSQTQLCAIYPVPANDPVLTLVLKDLPHDPHAQEVMKKLRNNDNQDTLLSMTTRSRIVSCTTRFSCMSLRALPTGITKQA